MRALVTMGIVLAVSTQVFAADTPSRYYGGYESSTSDAWGTGEGGVREMVDELNLLIDAAEDARAADRRFITDLRELVARYDWPWQRELLRDDFADGDYTRDPAWRVTEGDFDVRRGGGLYSYVRPSSGTGAQPGGSQDLGTLLLGVLVEQLDKSEGQEQGGSAVRDTGRSVIRAEQSIPNAFAMRLAFSSFGAPGGRMQFAVYQDTVRMDGYRLVYNAGVRPGFELVRITSRGEAVIEVFDQSVALEDGRSHEVQWTRDRAGRMVLRLDGEELFQAYDRGFQQSFAGLAVINDGGEFLLHEVVLNGTD